VATDPDYVDPSAVTAELETVPGQRGEPPSRRRPGGGPPPAAPVAAGAASEPQRGRSHKGLVIGGVTVIVLAGAATGAYAYSRGQYYTKVSEDGKKVVLYQGMTQLSFLSKELTTPDLPVAHIPLSLRGDATSTKTFSSEHSATAYLDTVRTAVDSCENFWKNAGALPVQGGSPTAPASSAPTTSAPPAVRTGSDIPSGGPTGPLAGATNNGGAALPSTPQASDGSLSPDAQSPGSSDTATNSPSASAPSTTPAPQADMAQYCAGTNG
jgi:hypothetical protein